jgi:hypothetical protein
MTGSQERIWAAAVVFVDLLKMPRQLVSCAASAACVDL